jgi:hypothetical protein
MKHNYGITTKFALMSLLFFSSPLYAAESAAPPPMPLEVQEKAAAINNTLTALETLKTSLDQLTVQKTNECMKAIGNTEFCTCIANESPGSISFLGYVEILTKTKEQLQYDLLTPENKKLVDVTRTARDHCVNWKGK